MKDEHSRLVHSIIKEEETFTAMHRQHVDRMVEFIKKVGRSSDSGNETGRLDRAARLRLEGICGDTRWVTEDGV